MNYLAHALPFLDRPYFVAGTGVPDWLTVADRQTRVRIKQVEPFMADADPITTAVARGAAQHIRDDLRFHATRAFAETNLELTARVRRVLGSDVGFRPALVGHLLVELLLDATLAEEQPARLEAYYQALEEIDANTVQEVVNRFATRPTQRLAPFIVLFHRERVLWDYLEDGRLMRRLGQVIQRVGFAPLPDGIAELLPGARQLVRQKRSELLAGIPA